jgi:hypothetical protein
MVLKHVAAMQLILSMQDNDGKFFNVDFVAKTDKDARLVIPPLDQMETKFRQLHDLLALVDEGVYTAYHNMLSAELGPVTPGAQFPKKMTSAEGLTAMKTNSQIYQLITDNANAGMWCEGVPEHPTTYLMWEVVAELLA